MALVGTGGERCHRFDRSVLLVCRDIANFCVLFAGASLASAQPADSGVLKSVRVVRTDVAPVIDGVLDEEVWKRAGKVTDFYEVSPDEYDEAAELTEVFILYDKNNLYIAAKLSQSQPNGITAQVLRQGEGLWGDDYFGVILDPFNNRRNGYLFQLNPNGVRAEALYENTTQTQFDWVGIWQGKARIQEDGWIAEMSIPFRTLSFDPKNDTWGINFTRQIARTHERIGWVSRTRAQNPSIAGVAVGFGGLDQGRGIDILTSFSVRNSKEYVGGTTVTEKEPSVDVFYKFTPALTGVMTVNTDFSATEIDDRQVNLTRYSLFFPEKRDFFLQDADIF
ncbi:MAG: carbohydrate binding family 9 domain-containing protein, partial [Gammaproteobacteria bacterium]